MKVLKFGGTSVGSVDSIRQIQQIIAKQTDDCIVVVSALGGITDQLLKAAHLALQSGETYMEVYQQIRQRHLDMVNTLIDNATVRQMLLHELDATTHALTITYDGSLGLLAQVAHKVYAEKNRAQFVQYPIQLMQ